MKTKEEKCENCGYIEEVHDRKDHDFKSEYPRNLNGVCSGCGCSVGSHKRFCPADIGRNSNGDKPCEKFKPKNNSTKSGKP